METKSLTPTSTRLNYRRWAPSDAEVVLSIFSKPEVNNPIKETMSSLKEAEAKIEEWNSKTQDGFGVWAIVPKEGEFSGSLDQGSPVGLVFVGLYVNEQKIVSDKYELAWILDSSVWRKGYATEAGQAVIQLAKECGVARVYAVTYPENEKSMSVCQRLGMKKVGLTQEWYDETTMEYFLDLN